MYKFRDLSIDRKYEAKELPVEALNYGGHWLDREIDGYQTLVTSGRQTFARQVNSAQRSGDGNTYLSSRIEARKITVTFVFNARTINEYNERLNKLRQILSQPNQPFYFADNQDYHFVGTVSELSLDKDTLNSTGKITITVSDPYQYGKAKIISGDGDKLGIVDTELVYAQAPKKLLYTPVNTAGNLIITNGNKKIELSVGIEAGKPLEIDFEKLAVSIDHVDSLMGLTLDSNLGDFYIENGSIIEFNFIGHFELSYEVKML